MGTAAQAPTCGWIRCLNFTTAFTASGLRLTYNDVSIGRALCDDLAGEQLADLPH